MFTQEQKDRKLDQAQQAVDDAQNRVNVHSDRLNKAKADLATAKATQEWLKSMPVNGSTPAAEPEPEPAV
jgi:peptidoglycan hydrolase CwlO-like protein